MDTLKRMGSIAVQAVASTALMKRLVMAMPAAALVGFLGISLAASNAFGAFIQGPVDASGFPTYVQDGNGLRLAQCLDPGGGCGLAAEILPLFPVYWSAQARMATYGGKGGNPDASRPGGAATATLTMQLGGSYTINPVTGERDPSGTPIVLQSLQLQIDGLRDGFDYTGTTPFGVLDALTANVETDAFGRTTNTDAIKVVFEAELGVVDPFDPHQNLRGGARYLARQIREFGSIRLALAAYHAGAGRVRRNAVPAQTWRYVRRVQNKARHFGD